MNGRGKTIALLLLLVLLVFAGRFYLLLHSELVYDEEEYKTGSIAYLLMHERLLPVLEHQPGDYEGGTLLFGILMIPFFAVFGPKYLALKLLAITTTLVTALVAAYYARRHSGLPAAMAAGALFVLPSAYVLQIGLLPWGNYAENAMLSLATLLIAARVWSQKKPALPVVFLFGALLGLGVWMHYGFLVAVVLASVLWWLIDPRFLLKPRGWVWCAGGVVGFLPWLIYNINHNWWGLRRFGDAVGATGNFGDRLIGFFQRLALLLTVDLPAGLHFRADSLAAVKALSYVYYLLSLALVVLLVVLLRKKAGQMLCALWPRAPRTAPDASFWALAPVGYLVLYILVYAFSDYGLFSREWGTLDPESHCHIFALYPMMLLADGLAVGAAWRTRWRIPVLTALAGLLVLGAVGFAGLLTPERPQHERLSRDAYDRGVIYMEIGTKWGADHAQLAKIQQRLEGQALRSFVFGAGIKYGHDHATSFQVALDKCAAQPDALLPYCWFGIGTGLYSARPVPLDQLDALVSGAPEQVKPWLELGACVGNIWTGLPEHPSCARAQTIKVKEIAPPEEADTLSVFVEGHLLMQQFRPEKQ